MYMRVHVKDRQMLICTLLKTATCATSVHINTRFSLICKLIDLRALVAIEVLFKTGDSNIHKCYLIGQ